MLIVDINQIIDNSPHPILIPAIMQKMEISSEKVLTSTEMLSLLEYHKHSEKMQSCISL